MVLKARLGRDDGERAVVHRLASARKAPRDVVERCRMVELSWDGWLVPQLADELRCSQKTVAAAGEKVVDVPSTLSARARLLATGGDSKTDAADALHVAQVALFRQDLRTVEPEDQSTILRLLTERHDDLVNERTRIIN
ncbi:transposase [Streptomyces sp. TLI_185]|uniref:IS110 family transposase n=1 Tax=Streptomyces sp. TLI_185 TaxID=2485151 RepID=UPI001C84FEFF|nr:transposase [Streptomyces sp. TLI_185]